MTSKSIIQKSPEVDFEEDFEEDGRTYGCTDGLDDPRLLDDVRFVDLSSISTIFDSLILRGYPLISHHHCIFLTISTINDKRSVH
jgi:hypothetical protein